MVRGLILLADNVFGWVYFAALLFGKFEANGAIRDNLAARVHHWVCYPTLVAFLLDYIFVPHELWWKVTNLALTPPVWYWLHRTLHRHDKHKRRLRDAARGLVQRFHNRLIVIPESTN